MLHSYGMKPPRQVTFADEKYMELAHTILNSRVEPLVADVCIACASCPVATSASFVLCPEVSMWCHLAAGGVAFCSFFSCFIHDLPEDSSSELLTKKIKRDFNHLCKKIKYE